MKKTVLVIIDSLGVKQFNEENTPFLYSLSYYKPMNTCLGFSISILPSLYTGVYPNKHGYFTKIIKEKKNKKSIRALLLNWLPDTISRPINYVISYGIKSRVLPSISLKYEHNFKMLDFNFKVAHKEINNCPTIFNSLTNNFQYVIDTNDFKISDSKKEIDVYYTIEIDRIMHLNLKNKKVMKKYLRKVDNKVKQIYNFYNEKYKENLEFLVVSDHGQADIQNRINVLKRIKRIKNIKEGKDYLMFSDSTMARFWTKSDKVKQIIIDVLSKVKQGNIISKEEQKKLHINFKNNRYGDIIFLMNEHNEIYPSHFHMYLKSNVHGLHGYHTDCESMKGIFVYKGSKKIKKKQINVVDIAPSLLKLNKKSIPKNTDGQSLW